MVVPQITPVTDAGLVDMLMLTTWNGPGSLHTPVGATVVETSVFPDMPTLIEPLTADAEFIWIMKLLSVYCTAAWTAACACAQPKQTYTKYQHC